MNNKNYLLILLIIFFILLVLFIYKQFTNWHNGEFSLNLSKKIIYQVTQKT